MTVGLRDKYIQGWEVALHFSDWHDSWLGNDSTFSEPLDFACMYSIQCLEKMTKKMTFPKLVVKKGDLPW